MEINTDSLKSSENGVFQATQKSVVNDCAYSIREVLSSKDLKVFLNLPDLVYPKGSKYVRPLNFHVKMMIGRLNTPNKHLYIVYHKDQPILRAGFKVHSHANKEALHFGFFECQEGHQEAVKQLFQFAHSKYPHLPIRGPFHFRMEDPYIGILTEGYDIDPYFLMSYNPAYYNEYLEHAGFHKLMDLFTYQVRADKKYDPIITENAQKAKENGYAVRKVNRHKLRDEAFVIASIFNDALSKNWGFEEFIESQVDEMVMMFKFFLDMNAIYIAHKDGKDIGCLLMIPNFNHMIKSARGKITPELIYRYFRRFKEHKNEIRGYALGVKKEAHGQGIGSLLVDEGWMDMYLNQGYMDGEISWVLSNNGPMNELSKAMNGKHNKIYRIYERQPTNA